MKNKSKLHLHLHKTGGRNNKGQMTMYTIGGGVKKKYRIIDFKRVISTYTSISMHSSFSFPSSSSPSLFQDRHEHDKAILKSSYAFIIRLEKDPMRSAYVALICYPNGVLSYIIATEKMHIGSRVYNFSPSPSILANNQDLRTAHLKSGNSFIISMLPSGSLINNIELYPKMGGVLMRAAGVWAQIIKKYNNDYIQIKLKSGEHRLIHKNCRVTLGVVSNIYNNQNKLTKAGQSRLLGKRPVVRGRAMNPVDHPHGGRTNGGTAPKTPWGVLTKGKKTRNIVRTNQFIITRKSA